MARSSASQLQTDAEHDNRIWLCPSFLLELLVSWGLTYFWGWALDWRRHLYMRLLAIARLADLNSLHQWWVSKQQLQTLEINLLPQCHSMSSRDSNWVYLKVQNLSIHMVFILHRHSIKLFSSGYMHTSLMNVSLRRSLGILACLICPSDVYSFFLVQQDALLQLCPVLLDHRLSPRLTFDEQCLRKSYAQSPRQIHLVAWPQSFQHAWPWRTVSRLDGCQRSCRPVWAMASHDLLP